MSNQDHIAEEVAEEADKIIEQAKQGCVDRGEHDGLKLGKCHVFLEGSNICVCEGKRLRVIDEVKPEKVK